jgi:hypothetical protein
MKLAQILVQMAALVEVVTAMELLLELKLEEQESQAKVLLEDWVVLDQRDIQQAAGVVHPQLAQIILRVKQELVALGLQIPLRVPQLLMLEAAVVGAIQR